MAVMGAYNKFRGEHCCSNNALLNVILKGEWGFQGGVISDWGGTHDTREAVTKGLDLEMGSRPPYDDFKMAKAFRDGVKDGTYPISLLEDKVRRDLRVLFASGAVDGRKLGSLNTPGPPRRDPQDRRGGDRAPKERGFPPADRHLQGEVDRGHRRERRAQVRGGGKLRGGQGLQRDHGPRGNRGEGREGP